MTLPTSAQIQTLLTDILGETASSTGDQADLSMYMADLNAGTITNINALATAITSSPEASIVQAIYRLYEGVLGRAPDAAGLQFWVGIAEQGLTAAQIQAGITSVPQATLNSIAAAFTGSPEFQTIDGGASLDATGLVTLLYKNVLARAPDSAGLAFWTGQLNSGASLTSVVEGFVNSSEFINDTQQAINGSVLNAALIDSVLGSGPTYANVVTPPLSTAGVNPAVAILNATNDETGFAVASLILPVGLTSGAGDTTSFTNLAASGTVILSNNMDGAGVFGAGGFVGSVLVSQVAVPGSGNLTVELGLTAGISEFTTTEVNNLTTARDNSVTIFTDPHAQALPLAQIEGGVDLLTDSTNTIANIVLKDGNLGDITFLGGVSSTSVKVIDASAIKGVVDVGFNPALLSSPLALSGITVRLSSGGISNVDLSGNGNTIVQANGANDGGVQVTSGNDSVVSIGNSLFGDKVTVGSGSMVTAASGNFADTVVAGADSTVSISAAAYTITVGSGSTVNILTPVSTFVGIASIVVSGDLVGATSSGNFSLTTITGATDGSTSINLRQSNIFNYVDVPAAVNVSGATTLAGALDIAAAAADTSPGQIAGVTASLVWFQFGGNTYLVEAINGSSAPIAHTGLAATDAIVKLTGLINLHIDNFHVTNTGLVTI